jgi:hypothetical protein
MLIAFAFLLFLDTPAHFPIGALMLFGIAFCLPFLSIAGKISQMKKAGTWMGLGSIACEENWNSAKGNKREGMLIAAGIGKDDPDHAVLLGVKWEEVPAERRCQIFEKSRWGPKAKKTPEK